LLIEAVTALLHYRQVDYTEALLNQANFMFEPEQRLLDQRNGDVTS